MLLDAARSSVKRIQEHVLRSLSSHPAWPVAGDKPRIGLAISGGVDSMALATVCRGIQTHSFTGFVVDHGLRPESASEAEAVVAELARLDIPSHVLKPDWSSVKDPSVELKKLSNVESLARTLRYQTLGKACAAQGIERLVVAHHMDDQAETVLLRVLAGYLGIGLRGIRWATNVADCHEIWGPAGFVGMQQKRGTRSRGLKLLRPLLSYTKDELTQVCREEGTQWFEDATNKDLKLTTRNTVRFLLERDLLPTALRKDRLLGLVKKISTKEEKIDLLADELMERLSIILDLRYGTVTLGVSPGIRAVTSEGQDYEIKAVVLRRIMYLVSPKSKIPLQDLDEAVDLVFPARDNNNLTTAVQPTDVDSVRTAREPSGLNPVQTAEVRIARFKMKSKRPDASSQSWFRLSRSPPPHDAIKDVDLGHPNLRAGPITWTEWKLWDHRYWIRVGCLDEASPNEQIQFCVRFASNESLGELRRRPVDESRLFLDDALDGAGGSMIRRTLPMIVAKQNEDETVFALPSLWWTNPPEETGMAGWRWEVRYKGIEFEGSGVGKHVIKV